MSNARNPRSHPTPNLYPVPSLGDLADVSAEFPADGDTLIWDEASNLYINGAGGGGGLPDRGDTNITTASLADATDETGTVGIGGSTGVLLAITADRACWVRLYVDSASRTSDASRDLSVDPTPGSGVLADFYFIGAGTIKCAPPPVMYNLDGPVDNILYYSIRNKSGSTSTVSVDLTIVLMEA